MFLALFVSCTSRGIDRNSAEWRKDCRNGVCIYVTRAADQSENFEVESTLSYPIILTLNVEFASASKAPIVNRGQVSKVIHPKEKVLILSLEAEQPDDEVLFNYQYSWR